MFMPLAKGGGMEINMGRKLNKDIMSSFRDIYHKKEIFSDYINYYSALVLWVKNHIDLFTKEQLENSRLDVLININPAQYIIEEPEIDLELEYKRVAERIYESMEDLVMTIGDTLWDLVTIRTGKDCPNCVCDELRYVIAQDKVREKCELVLECETCGWTEHINGKQWKEGIVKIIPANVEDIKLFEPLTK